MHIDVKTKNENGDIIFEGKLNRNEVSFLLQYSINDLIAAGVEFNLQLEQDEDDDEAPSRIVIPKGAIN